MIGKLRRSARAAAFAAAALAVGIMASAPTSALAQAAASADTPAPAPRPAAADDWSIKGRARIQIDYGSVDAPLLALPANQAQTGPDVRIRRAYVGVDGTIPGGLGYRFEADFATDPVSLTDAYLYYKATPRLTITAGQHKGFWGLEEMTSDLFTSFQERAAFTSAFGFERRIGISAAYARGPVLVQAGVFTDDAVALGFPASSLGNRDFGDYYSLDGRVVYMPKLGKGQLHIGGSIHYRDFRNIESVRYRARPFLRTTDLRFEDTGGIAGADGELGLGLEAAYVQGRFHATAESYWQKVRRPGLASPTFNGGYAEVGFLLTNDTTSYRGGVYDRIKPKRPVGKGGFGAVQLNARYDWLNLEDAGIRGGQEQTAALSLVWVPTAHTRFIADYGHIWLHDSPVAAADGRRDYGADTFGMRAQFDF